MQFTGMNLEKTNECRIKVKTASRHSLLSCLLNFWEMNCAFYRYELRIINRMQNKG